ncbi:hypothetical protein [Pedobacter sp. P26]|uniref:hypothetical protein n=1 Tax=Pedobacter sp. P26 TaxID=3423956 RepID=UPI003D678AC0
MNEPNLEYLKKTLEYLGFGTKLNDVMETAIRREIPKFSVGISSYFEPPLKLGLDLAQKDTVHFTLDFNKAKENDTYFLNDYSAELKSHNGIQRAHSFNLERDHRVTAGQAYRLLLGAAIQKDIVKRAEAENSPAEKQQIWMKVDLDILDSFGKHPVAKVYPNYGFDISETLDKYPIIWKHDKEKDAVIADLRKGIFPEVAMDFGNRISPVVISANPRMRNLDVYDTRMNVIRNDRIFPDQATPQRVELMGKGNQQASGHELPNGVSQTQDQEVSDQHNRGRGR